MVDKINNLFYAGFLLILSVGTVFLNIYIFVDHKIMGKWFSLILMSIIGAVLLLFRKDRRVGVSYLHLILIVLYFYCFIRSFSDNMPTIDFSFYLSIPLLYILFKSFKDENILADSVFLIIALIQAVYGLLQYFALFPSHDTFRMLGSYANPAGLAATLTAVFPLSFIFIGKYKRPTYIFIGIVSIVTILSGSRAGMLSLLGVSVLFFFNNLSERLKLFKRQILCGVITLVISTCIYLFFVKENSAIGRTLIWQVTSDLIQEDLLFGGGYYAFYKGYMLHQAEYFAQNHNHIYRLLAGNVVHPFNEYLLMTSRYGIFVLLLLVLSCTFLIRKTKLTNPYMLCLISISIFSLFSYPLQYPFIWVLIIYCIVQIDGGNKPIINLSEKWIHIFLVPVVFSNLYLLAGDIRFEYKWNKAAQNSLKGKFRAVQTEYQKLYDSWNGNHLFLYNYAAELNLAGEYQDSNIVLDKTTSFWNDYDIQMLYADNFDKLQEDQKQEEHLKVAANMCPNRFLPLFNLHELYVQNNRIPEALEIAQRLVVKEVKIPSPTVFSIKNKMNIYINSFDKTAKKNISPTVFVNQFLSNTKTSRSWAEP